MITEKRITGNKGEKAVCKYLKKQGCKIIKRNFSCKLGEIDIIAENKEYILFVEVKTRSTGQMLPPREAVGYKKRSKILKTAQFFLKKYDKDKQPRFDIAEVFLDDKGKMSINYFDNAFAQESKNYAAF